MKNVLTFLLIGSFAFLFSCKDDEEPTPPHEVGDWTLENVALLNVPNAFARFEGATFDINIFDISSYSLKLNNDGSFSRTVKETGRLSDTDKGNWSLKDDIFSLVPEESDEEEYEVFTNEENELWIGNEATFLLIPDTTIQRLANEYGSPGYQTYLDTVNSTTYDSFHKQAVLDFILVFARTD